MRRVAHLAMILAATTVLLAPPALAQTTQPTHSSLTPEQRAQMRAMNPKFTACHHKAVAAKVGPKDRRAFMKSCLADKN